MSLEVQINNDIKQAMLNKDKAVLESLRAIKSAILLLKTGKDVPNGEVSEAAEVAMLQKLVKQRREAADIYVQQNRQDLADEELFQAGVIERYLPKQLSRQEIEAEVRAIIAEVGATSPKDMGRVMGQASKRFAGKADNRIVSEVVKAILSQQA
ncbi:MAG: GatB/YqeY domain-containing protein [Bacteroidales bacterium]|nr:GatB/YqeY domain-containing protein [Bacteroidales bacterium]